MNGLRIIVGDGFFLLSPNFSLKWDGDEQTEPEKELFFVFIARHEGIDCVNTRRLIPNLYTYTDKRNPLA